MEFPASFLHVSGLGFLVFSIQLRTLIIDRDFKKYFHFFLTLDPASKSPRENKEFYERELAEHAGQNPSRQEEGNDTISQLLLHPTAFLLSKYHLFLSLN